MMKEKVESIIGKLKSNNIDAVYVETKEQAASAVKEMLFDGCTITAGGSVSLAESGIWEIMSDKRYNFLDRTKKGLTEEERLNVFKNTVGSDFFFCSANAVTENGEIVNVDGTANRISAIVFGPKRVIMIVGVNKIVKDLNEAFLRVKKIAAPKNCVRLGLETPCAKLGHCVSLLKTDNPAMTDGCASKHRICREYLVTSSQSVTGRMTVIFCGEELGY